MILLTLYKNILLLQSFYSSLKIMLNIPEMFREYQNILTIIRMKDV